MITAFREVDLPENIIAEKLQEKFHLAKEQIEEYLQTVE